MTRKTQVDAAHFLTQLARERPEGAARTPAPGLWAELRQKFSGLPKKLNVERRMSLRVWRGYRKSPGRVMLWKVNEPAQQVAFADKVRPNDFPNPKHP